MLVDKWLSCEDVWWTVVAGPLLLDEPVRGETREEHLRNFVPTRSDVDENGTNCHSIAARVIHAWSSSGCRIWTRRCSASDQQSRDTSSSEEDSESHRCEKPWLCQSIYSGEILVKLPSEQMNNIYLTPGLNLAFICLCSTTMPIPVQSFVCLWRVFHFLNTF